MLLTIQKVEEFEYNNSKFSRVYFTSEFVSGSVKLEGSFSKMDKYELNNRVIDELGYKFKVNTTFLNYIKNAKNLSGAQIQLTKNICFDPNQQNKEVLSGLIPKWTTASVTYGGSIWYAVDSDGFASLYYQINQLAKGNTANPATDTKNFVCIWSYGDEEVPI